MLCAKVRTNQWNRLGGVWKSRFSTFCQIAKKKRSAEMGVACSTRFSTIHWTCATKYMGVISQNTLPLIVAPPSGGNSGWQWIITFFARCDLYSKFGEFWGMFRQWKMWSFGRKKKILRKTIGTSQVPCSSPNIDILQHGGGGTPPNT